MEDIEFLKSLNRSLVELENILVKDFNEDYPNIFILGLPRSGTTLLSQVLFNNLDIKCTNNLMAKFWDTPIVGLKISELTINKEKSDYSSTYGKTNSISDPHEFTWFWHNHLKLIDIETYDPERAMGEIDWDTFKKVLVNFNHITKRVFVHKPLELVGYHLEKFYNLFEKGIFIYIERPLHEIACSLLDARINYYNDVNVWWGSYPPRHIYDSIKNEEFDIQISSQVKSLEKMYKEKFEQIDNNRLIRVRYEELCNKPQLILDKVRRLSNHLGYSIQQVDKPKSFSPSNKLYEADIYRKVISKLNRNSYE